MPKQRTAAHRADPLELVEHRLARARSRRRRWKVIANRCASSRMRRSSCSPGECSGSSTGPDGPGTNTSSTRFASAITATRGRS